MSTIHCRNVKFTGVKAVVFDKDGTLANSELFLKQLGQQRSLFIGQQVPAIQPSLLMAFGLHKDTLDPSGLLAVGSRRENEIAAAAYIAETGQPWLTALAIAQNAFQAADCTLPCKAEQTPPFTGLMGLLDKLQAVGIKIGILSSDTTKHVLDFVKFYQLESYVAAYLGGDGPIAKPDPRLLHQICESLQARPEETVMIGDALVDIEMSKAAGAMGCIGVTWGWAMMPVLTGADAIATTIDEIQVWPTSSPQF